MSDEYNETCSESNAEMWEKFNKCKHGYVDYDRESKSLVYKCGYFSTSESVQDEQNIETLCPTSCDNCKSFESKYIEFPITVNAIVNNDIHAHETTAKAGDIVLATLASDDDSKPVTHIGIYIGDFPVQITSRYNHETKTLTNASLNNPVIHVPELKKNIYGYECFWHKATKQQLMNYRDKYGDSDNAWYMYISDNAN